MTETHARCHLCGDTNTLVDQITGQADLCPHLRRTEGTTEHPDTALLRKILTARKRRDGALFVERGRMQTLECVFDGGTCCQTVAALDPDEAARLIELGA